MADLPLDLARPMFIKQRITNICGLMALLHATINVQDQISFPFLDGSFLQRLSQLTASSPEQRADYLESDSDIEQLHKMFSTVG